jgi:hypothetical protein
MLRRFLDVDSEANAQLGGPFEDPCECRPYGLGWMCPSKRKPMLKYLLKT